MLDAVTAVWRGIFFRPMNQSCLEILQNVSNRLCFLASLITFLESGSLATREDVMELLGGMRLLANIYIYFLTPYLFLVEIDRKNGFHIDLEDYLIGLLSLVNELVRSHNFVSFCDIYIIHLCLICSLGWLSTVLYVGIINARLRYQNLSANWKQDSNYST